MTELRDIFKNIRTHLMNGVSYMIPVVVGGGILMAFAVLLTGEGAAPEMDAGLAYWLWTIGADALTLMCPVLAAFIAYSIADRPGIAPGLAGGYMATNIPTGTEKVHTLVEITSGTKVPEGATVVVQNGVEFFVSTSEKVVTVSAGFLGAILAGLLAGIIAFYLKKIRLPKSMNSLKSIIIIPLCSVLIVGAIMFVFGVPIAAMMSWMEESVKNMADGEHGAWTLAGISALASMMIAFDLGGPVNKVAYSILMVAFVGSGIYTFAAPVGIAICVPPIGAGVASMLLKRKFSIAEQNAGIGAVAMGICGITEGAISYTTSDPTRMIPINIISSALAGGVAGFIGVGAKMSTCWGGIIVAPVIQGKTFVTGWPAYLFCIAVGVLTYVVLCAVLKKDYTVEDVKTDEDIEITFT
ncbi:MAG: PTS transporter subunit EIIC [Lachnospiraceae bacterium]|nr:PTS transporter subunit EIIC [Lachnospiraceae bacterium]